jgi:hypothetical protein
MRHIIVHEKSTRTTRMWKGRRADLEILFLRLACPPINVLAADSNLLSLEGLGCSVI